LAILQVDSLAVEYHTAQGSVRAVDGASFEVPQGSVLGLVGESGCGKTTVARAITGVMPSNARLAGGLLVFKGRDLAAAGESERKRIRWRDISFIPQSAMNSLDPVYTVGRQIEEVLIHRGGLSRPAAGNRAAELFRLVGLSPSRLKEFPHQFSGGMRQRVAIALALALEPSLVIADEPVTALDVIVQRQVLDVIRDLQKRLHLSMILVTHDISVVAYVCDRVVVMYAGKVVEDGSTADLLERPLHPYTMGLTNAFPDLERAGSLLVPIEGSPPDLLDPPKGCRFAPRCPFALPICTEVEPALVGEDGHRAACHRRGEAHLLRERARDAATWAER
jgi:peptide/nickel transport system ATP-binding protein